MLFNSIVTRINTVKQAIEKAYEVLSTENDSIIKQFSNYENEITKLKAMKFDEQMVYHNTSQNKPSFSSIVKRQPNLIPEQPSFKSNSNVIMIVPKNDATLSPRALEIDIKKRFKPSEHNIKINKTFSTAKGLGLKNTLMRTNVMSTNLNQLSQLSSSMGSTKQSLIWKKSWM
ncbi:hypothetical protein BLOT_009294 [Blomia tropicalis]|nr:hypothetical protein BLOT_009294 [Blomia tropicalis]